MYYKVIEDHKVRSISSGIYIIEKGRTIQGEDIGNGYIKYRWKNTDLYVPIEKVKPVAKDTIMFFVTGEEYYNPACRYEDI